MENLRVDVIYYTVQSDFEMEFNLGGCCRMRLLTACTEDRKAHLKALSYAVSRSKIILTCGPLFGQTGLIYITAKAIGKDLVKINNKDYGIADDGEIEIINGSLPLVTSNGIFGGCIIESGPQTLIMLSENRAIRKDIMQNLIHPYIEEISYLDVSKGFHKEQPTAETPAEETPAPETPAEPEVVKVIPTPIVPEIVSEEVIPDQAAETETESTEETNESIPLVSFESDKTENQPQEADETPKAEETEEKAEEITQEKQEQEEKQETPVKTEIEQKPAKEEKNPAYTPFVFEEEKEGNPEDGYYDEDYYADENANSSNKIAVFIIVAMILIIAVTLGYIFLYLPYKEGISISEFARKLFSSFGL